RPPEQTSGADLYSRPLEHIIRRRQSQLTYLFEGTCDTSTRCWNGTPEISGVNSIGVSQTSIMSEGPDQAPGPQQSTRTTTTRGVRRTRLASIEEGYIQLFPRYYKATTTILLSSGEAQVL
ncbi:hypothetical protein Tco_1130620, partial [Tanacetum coccineum]